MADLLTSERFFSKPAATSCGGNCASCPGDAMERWRRAGTRVRQASEPDEPRLLERYLTLTHQLAQQQPARAWDTTVQCFQLLLDSCADRDLPLHWCQLCLDHCHRPLDTLAALAHTEARCRYLATLGWRLVTVDMSEGVAYEALSELPAARAVPYLTLVSRESTNDLQNRTRYLRPH